MQHGTNMALNQDFLERFQKLIEKVDQIKEEVAEIQKVKTIVTESKDNLESLSSSVQEIKDENAGLRGKLYRLETENNLLKIKINELDQYSRKGNVIINGIPSYDNENVINIITKIAEALGTNLCDNDISAAHRLPTANRKWHPPIVVKLTSLRKRDELIHKSKQLRISTDRIGFKDKEPIFIDEHLTSQNAKLVSKALQLKKAGNLAHAWHRDGKIFVRKSINGPAIKIDNEDQLQEAAAQDVIRAEEGIQKQTDKGEGNTKSKSIKDGTNHKQKNKPQPQQVTLDQYQTGRQTRKGK